MEAQMKKAIAGNLPFAIYKLPDKKKINIIIQDNQDMPLHPFDSINDLTGFFVAPFRGESINHTFCIQPDHYFELNQNELIELEGIRTADSNEVGSEYEMSKKEYLERADYLIEVLKDGQLRKVVLSRVMDYPLQDTFRLEQFMRKLLSQHGQAFVYLVNLPGMGLWAGATPEVLLKMEKDHAETVALAGTQPFEGFDWTEKEIKEQRIVMDYIEELLYSKGITEYGKTGPATIKAGNVVHLKTKYNLSKEQTEKEIGALIAGLHPTPAVCGLPRNKAYSLIRKVEKHERGFYSGFIGPWNINDQSQLFVNLRCANVFKDKMSLFIGGGLTSESKAESEWEETVRKSHTLLSVVEKM